MITIEEITPITGFRVETNDETYYRWSADSWTIVIGESEEPVYNCAELEGAFQIFKSKNK